MSTDVNARSEPGIIGWAKGLLKTWANRMRFPSKVNEQLEEIADKTGIPPQKFLETGWSTGNLFRGRFYSPKTGKMFNEKSFAVDIRGVPFEVVKKAARALLRKFDQEGVLVIDHKNNKTYYMD